LGGRLEKKANLVREPPEEEKVPVQVESLNQGVPAGEEKGWNVKMPGPQACKL